MGFSTFDMHLPRESFGIILSHKIKKAEHRACILCAYYITLLIIRILFPDNHILCIAKKKKMHQMAMLSSAVVCAEAYSISHLQQTPDKLNLCLQTLKGRSWLIRPLSAVCARAAQ